MGITAAEALLLKFAKLFTRDTETIQPLSSTPPISDMCLVGFTHVYKCIHMYLGPRPESCSRQQKRKKNESLRVK